MPKHSIVINPRLCDIELRIDLYFIHGIEYLAKLIYNMCYVVNNVKGKNYIRYKGKAEDYKAKTSNLI